MEERSNRSESSFRWVMWGLVVTFLTMAWSSAVILAQRRHRRSVFEPTLPTFPDWLSLTVPAALTFQLVASVVVVWRAKKSRLPLGAVLFVLWCASVYVSWEALG